MSILINLNLNQWQVNAFTLVMHQTKRVAGYLILKFKTFLFLKMFYNMKPFFPYQELKLSESSEPTHESTPSSRPELSHESIPSPCLLDQTKVVRIISKPSQLDDYICSSSSLLMCANSQGAIEIELSSFGQANKNEMWRSAMKDELEVLIKNGTWEMTILPSFFRPISCKWVYKIKRKPYGSINKFKARLVAKDFMQIFGLDFHNSFTPVAKVVRVRIMLTIVVCNKWKIHQLDINNILLHEKLEKDLYMIPLQGLETPPGKV